MTNKPKVIKDIDEYISTPEDFWNYLDKDFFTTSKDNREKAIKKVLHNFSKVGINTLTEYVSECFKEFWVNYSSNHIAKVLQSFPKVEKAFYGLELEEEIGSRYRDHFLHMFNIFTLGSAILSQIISKLPNSNLDKYIERIFKITGEGCISDFPWPNHKYTAKGRLFFLWTLISTFHDVGIPIEHAPNLRKNLNKYFLYFGCQIPEFILTTQPTIAVRISYFFTLLSQLWHPDKGIILENGLYKRYTPFNPYINGLLCHLFNKQDHSIFSAICLLSSVEASFIEKRKDKYNLKSESDFRKYTDKIFEQDIARAALTISLHNLNPKEAQTHNIFPMDFLKSPFLFLLVLCDELQEYLRPEGISISPIIKLKKLPKLITEVSINDNEIDINIHVNFCYLQEINLKKNVILKQAKTHYKSYIGELITNQDLENLDNFLRWYWKQTTDRIESKLSFKKKNNTRISFELIVKKENEDGTLKDIHHFSTK